MSACIKCGSTEVYRVPQTAVEVSIAISWSRTANLDYHVCGDCGFVELFVADKSMLPHIAEKYSK